MAQSHHRQIAPQLVVIFGNCTSSPTNRETFANTSDRVEQGLQPKRRRSPVLRPLSSRDVRTTRPGCSRDHAGGIKSVPPPASFTRDPRSMHILPFGVGSNLKHTTSATETTYDPELDGRRVGSHRLGGLDRAPGCRISSPRQVQASDAKEIVLNSAQNSRRA